MSAALITAAAVLVSAVIASPFLLMWAQRREKRRAASGSISTSTADTLWQANQHLIETLQAENAKLILQRDRLVGLMDEKIAPALARIDEALKRDGELLAGNSEMLDALHARLEGNGDGLATHAR